MYIKKWTKYLKVFVFLMHNLRQVVIRRDTENGASWPKISGASWHLGRDIP